MRKKYSRYTKSELCNAVKQCKSYQQVLKYFGLKLSGGSQAAIKDKIKIWNIDTSHFTGRGWSKGLTKNTSESINQRVKQISYTEFDIFKNNTAYKGKTLKKYLLKSGKLYLCECCGMLPVWMNKPISLHVDHINGDRTDNRISNLRFLCPNCHQQTETWGASNRI